MAKCVKKQCEKSALDGSLFCEVHVGQNTITAKEFGGLFKRPKQKKEENIQIAVCNYIKSKYPDVIFTCDLASGMKLPKHVGARNAKMRSSRGLPDLFIAKPAYESHIPPMNNLYYGLFIELKADDVRLKNGNIKRTEHHDEQAVILARLNQLGYKAVFACGYNEAISVIDNYLG